MMQILAEGTHKLCDALSHWSAAKVLSEEEALSELLSHLSRHIPVYDTGKMSKTVLAMEQARSAWEERFLAIEGKWPPEGLSQEAADFVPNLEDEQLMVDFCTKVKKLCQVTLPKVCNLCPALKEHCAMLEAEAGRFEANHQLRLAVCAETSMTNDLLAFTINEGATDDGAMLKERTSCDGKCFLSKLMAIASMRPPPHAYHEPEAIAPGTTVRIDGAEGGYIAFSDTDKVKRFVALWAHGAGITKVIEAFLLSKLDSFVGVVYDSITTALKHVRPVASLAPEQLGSEVLRAHAALEKCLPGDSVHILGRSVGVEDIDYELAEPSDLAEHLRLPGVAELDPLRELHRLGSHLTVKCEAILDNQAVALSKLLPVLEMLAHVSGMLVVASFMNSYLLMDSDKLVIKCHSQNASTKVLAVAPIFFACLQWIESGANLTWMKFVESARACAMEANFKHPKSDLNTIVSFFSATWAPSAKRMGAALANGVITMTAQKLKNMTPSWSHVINGSKYNGALARRQLLGQQSLHLVVELIDDLGMLRTSVCELLPDDDPEENVAILEADGIVSMSKLALAVIAAVATIENPSAAESPAQADRLLEDKACALPEVLKGKLRAIAKR